jgi:hypothetical protein
MPAAAVFIVSAAATAATTVAAVAATVAATVATAVATAVAAAGSVVGTVTAALTSTIGQVVTTVGSVIQAVTASLKTGIVKLASAITKPLEPILLPIKNSLQAIYDYMKGVETWVSTQLKPYKELVDLIDTITGLAVIKDLTSGIAAVGKLLGDVADGKGESTAAAIAQLLAGITKTTVGILDTTREQYIALSDRIENFRSTIEANFARRMTEMQATIYQAISGVEDSLTGRSITVQRQVTAISRRIEDLPWFMSMLLRVLS